MDVRPIACLVAASLLAQGCLILPETTQTEVGSYTHDSAPEVSQVRPVVQVRPAGPALDVSAHWARTCTVWRSHIVEYRTDKEATFELLDCSGRDCGYVYLFALLVAPLTLGVSGIITAIVIKSSRSSIRREVKSFVPLSSACDAPAPDVRLRASVPGRPDVSAVTDAAGRARIDLGDPGSAAASLPITVHVDAPAGVAPIVIHRGPPGSQPIRRR